MPTILMVVFAVLIGYPLIQLMSSLYVRPLRRELNQLVRDIKADPKYQGEDMDILEWAINLGPPSSVLAVILPIFAPISLLAWTLEILRGKARFDVREAERAADIEFKAVSEIQSPGSSKHPVWDDDRFHRALYLSMDIEVKRLPISSLITLVVSTPCLLLALAAQGVRASVSSFFSQSTRRGLLSVKLAWVGKETR